MMRPYRKSVPGLLAWVIPLLLVSTPSADAQEFRGRINGVVTDNSGAVLPGVTVTATSDALIQPQVQMTSADGSYRLIALPAGVYTVTYEIPGFTTLKRENIRVVINQTLTVDVQLQVATLQETVTVTGDSPVVDTSTTTVGTNFTKELLTEIPNARDIWAAMAQAPGFQMTGYDVGGSHTGTQTGFLAYGVSQQRTTRVEGVNTTEGTDANAGYFDFGSFQEFQLGGAGNMGDQDTPGASMNITIKSGGDKFQGTFYSDWEGDATITDNVPDEFKATGGRQGGGFFVRNPLQRGNPIDRQYDINGDLGGPLWKQKAWFYYSYRLNDQYKYVLNFDELARSKLSNQYTFKGTFQIARNNQIIGYLNKREKLQALRDLGPDVPVSAAYFQSSRNYPMKVEWTSVLSDSMFLDVIAAQWYNLFPLSPQTSVGAFPEDQFVPGRLDIATSRRMAGGANITYQNQRRYKPQFAASLSWFKDGWGGSHDFKFGSEGRRERRLFLAPQPFNHVYYDQVLGVTPAEVEFYNTPNDGINQVNNVSFYLNDTWRFTKKLTLNLGLRVDYYKDLFPEQSVTPEGVPGLIGQVTDANLRALWTPFSVPRTVLSETTTIGPRAGFAYDISGNGKTVVKGFYGRFYFNSAPDTIAAQVNPVGRTRLRYRWTDLNGNLRIDNPSELGAFVRTVTGALPGAAGVTVDPNLQRPYGEEFSAHLEREIVEGLSGRVSYVYKTLQNEWDIVDVNRINAYTTPFTARDPGPDNVLGNSDDGPNLSLLDRTAVGERRVWMNAPGYDSNYDTIELAINRRFRDNWMFLTSFEYTWLTQQHSTDSTTSADGAAGNGKTTTFYWQPNRGRFGNETSSLWNYKILGRYVLPFNIGVSGSYKLQSGRNWGRSISVNLPVAGAEIIRVEPVTANRAPNVSITDVRFDKSFNLGRFGKVTGMVDVFNLFNHDTITTFRTTTVNFMEVTSLLDPRIVRFGFRYEF